MSENSTEEDVLQRYVQIVREGAVPPGLTMARDTELVELAKARILAIDARAEPNSHFARTCTSVGVPEVPDVLAAMQPVGEVSKVRESIWRVVQSTRPDSSGGTDAGESAMLVAHVKMYVKHTHLLASCLLSQPRSQFIYFFS